MSVRSQSLQSKSMLKRQRDESTDDNELSYVPAKQCKMANISRTNVPRNDETNAAALPIYQQLISAEGIAFIFGQKFSQALRIPAERVAIQYQITVEQAMEELRRLLSIKAFIADTDAIKISPTSLMDELWHAAILDTRLYADLQAALGVILHHRPAGATEREERDKRLKAMKTMYAAFFSATPLEHPLRQPLPIYDEPGRHHGKAFRITIRLATGISIPMSVDDRVHGGKIIRALESITGIPEASQRLLFDGNRIESRLTLASQGVSDWDTLELHEQQGGC